MRNVSVKLGSRAKSYEVLVGSNLLADTGLWTSECVSSSTRNIAIVSNEKVFGLYGEAVVESLSKQGFAPSVWLMKDGERYKNFESLQILLSFLSKNGLTRSDALLALGGGVVGDLAGFASAIYMRGIQFLQIPTTFLAMIDASVGGKTGINLESGKNLAGAFHQPSGVLVDSATLKTLAKRELSAGFYEAVKHGAIADETLLSHTGRFLKGNPINSFKNEFANPDFILSLETLLAKNIEFKADIVMGDETESPERNDSKSRKMLNFGHTVGHALEKVTSFQRFRHGEAVGYGMLVAAEMSKKLELLNDIGLELLNDVVASVGTFPSAKDIDTSHVIDAFAYDKKMIDESVDWILLEGIGKPTIVRGDEISDQLISEALDTILKTEPS